MTSPTLKRTVWQSPTGRKTSARANAVPQPPVPGAKPEGNNASNGNLPPPVQQPGTMAVGPVPPVQNAPAINNANAPNPALQSPNGVDSQADRIRQLKEAIQKRRAQQQAAAPEGAH